MSNQVYKPAFFRALKLGFISLEKAKIEFKVWRDQKEFWDYFCGKSIPNGGSFRLPCIPASSQRLDSLTLR